MFIYTKIANLIKDLNALYREQISDDERKAKFKTLLATYSNDL